MSYFTEIKRSMEFLANDPKTMFLGYNVRNGNMGMKAFNDINHDQLLEMPAAENLMVGAGIGLSIEGYKPVVYFERFDFTLNGIDAIVNHLMKYKSLSDGDYTPKCIFRAVIGRKKTPFFSGVTHTQDFTEAFQMMFNFPVIKLKDRKCIFDTYAEAYNSDTSYMIVEEADRYNED